MTQETLTLPVITTRVKNVVAIHLGLLPEDLKDDSNFVRDFGADSLDEVEIIMALEDEFSIEISDEQASSAPTIQQTVDVVAKLLQVAE